MHDVDALPTVAPYNTRKRGPGAAPVLVKVTEIIEALKHGTSVEEQQSNMFARILAMLENTIRIDPSMVPKPTPMVPKPTLKVSNPIHESKITQALTIFRQRQR
jgi:hypothetical protein